MLSIIKNYLSYNPNKNIEWGLGFTMAFVFAYNSAQKEYLPLLLLWCLAYGSNRVIIIVSVLSYAFYTYMLYGENNALIILLAVGLIFFMRDMYFLFKYRVSVLPANAIHRFMMLGSLAICVILMYYFKS